MVDDRRDVVLLRCRREVLAFVKHHLFLLNGLFALLGLGYGRDELGTLAALQHLLGGLTIGVKLSVPLGAVVGRVEDWVVEEGVGHGGRRWD